MSLLKLLTNNNKYILLSSMNITLPSMWSMVIKYFLHIFKY